MQNHNNKTIKTRDTVLRKIYHSLYLKGLCVRGSWRPNRTATDWPPPSYGHNSVSFLFSWAAQLGAWGPSLCWDMLLIPSSSLQLIWGPELQLLNWGAWGPPLPGAGSLYRILTPTPLNFLSLGLYNNLTPTLLPASVTISHSNQPLDSQGYILIFLDQMHLLFTQVHFLFWQLGWVGGQYATLCWKINLIWSDSMRVF